MADEHGSPPSVRRRRLELDELITRYTAYAAMARDTATYNPVPALAALSMGAVITVRLMIESWPLARIALANGATEEEMCAAMDLTESELEFGLRRFGGHDQRP